MCQSAHICVRIWKRVQPETEVGEEADTVWTKPEPTFLRRQTKQTKPTNQADSLRLIIHLATENKMYVTLTHKHTSVMQRQAFMEP